MVDRDKVIKGLTAHMNGGCNKNDCPWFECEEDGCLKSMFDAALKLLKEQEQTPGGWVSVKDKMPEDETEVVIFVQHKIGWYRAFAWHDAYGWHSSADEFSDGESDFVTHWMPLPEPPKGDEENADD